MLKCILYILVAVMIGCNQNDRPPKEKQHEPSPSITKPGATGTDSLIVTGAAVVFFEPDSLQLEKMRRITEDKAFRTGEHEYYYMSRNAKSFLQQHWPKLKTFEAKNFRYIVFVTANNSRKVIDLDKIADFWGMYMFEPGKEPKPGDMMSIDSEIPNYFSK